MKIKTVKSNQSVFVETHLRFTETVFVFTTSLLQPSVLSKDIIDHSKIDVILYAVIYDNSLSNSSSK